MKKIYYREAMERAGQLPDETTKALIIDLIHQVDPNTLLIEKKALPASLRANLVFDQPDTPPRGKPMRTSVTISGVVLHPAFTLPRLMWRDDPGKPGVIRSERLERERRFTMEESPYIELFNWYRRERDVDEPPFASQ